MSAEVVDLDHARAWRVRPKPVDPEHLARGAGRALLLAEAALAADRKKAYRGAARRIKQIYEREARLPELLQLAECMAKRARIRR